MWMTQMESGRGDSKAWRSRTYGPYLAEAVYAFPGNRKRLTSVVDRVRNDIRVSSWHTIHQRPLLTDTAY